MSKEGPFYSLKLNEGRYLTKWINFSSSLGGVYVYDGTVNFLVIVNPCEDVCNPLSPILTLQKVKKEVLLCGHEVQVCCKNTLHKPYIYL